MIGIAVEDFGLPVCGEALHNAEDILHGEIKLFNRQRAALDCFRNQRIIRVIGFRHFEIESGKDALYAVSDGAPVRHDQPFKAPFLPEHLRQEPFILRNIYAVEAVVGAHHRPRLLLPDRSFKRGKVDFAQGAFIDF